MTVVGLPLTPFGPCRACESRLRAERKAGQLLKKMEKKNKGGGNKRQRSTGGTSDTPTLSDHGISKDQSSDWQKLGEVPDDEFEAEGGYADLRPTQRLPRMSIAFWRPGPERLWWSDQAS